MIGNVLIIDDDENVRIIASRHLKHAGFAVETVDGGEPAQTKLRTNEFDVAIIDLSMPGINGFELLEWIKRHCPGTVPVVFSGTTLVEDAIRAVQEGAFDIISKAEGEYDVFIQHVRRAVEHKRLRDSRDELLRELQATNLELKNRLGQLEVAHSVLRSQAMALQTDLNRAMRIQQGLLPTELPFEDKVSLAAVYQPAGKVGGDFFDVYAVDDAHLAIYIADTTGHGVSSALLTMFLKHCVRGVCATSELDVRLDPGLMLRQINRSIIDEMFGRDLFVSMIYVVMNVETGELAYSSAGHPPLLLLHEGDVEPHRVSAPALGINADVLYTAERLTLTPDDLVLLYTDGVTEIRNSSGEYLGTERLRATMRSHFDGVDTLADAVLQMVSAFHGDAAPTDDITLLALSRTPQKVPFAPRVAETAPPEDVPPATNVEVATAVHDGILFIGVAGSGTWRESQRVLNLCNEAFEDGENNVVLDLSACNHLDSTFLGVLHNIARDFDESKGVRFEIQNIPHELLREMSELGLTQVLTHFRPEPLRLPESMKPLDGDSLSNEEMGRLLLWAHEALVDADPSNADRFAAVLDVLHKQVSGSRRGAE